MTGGNDRSTQDKIRTWLAGAGQTPRMVESGAGGTFAGGSNSKRAHSQAVELAMEAAEVAAAAAMTASWKTARGRKKALSRTTSTSTDSGDADVCADARSATQTPPSVTTRHTTILLDPDRIFYDIARQAEGPEEKNDLLATLDEHFVSTHAAVTSVWGAIAGMIAPQEEENPARFIF